MHPGVRVLFLTSAANFGMGILDRSIVVVWRVCCYVLWVLVVIIMKIWFDLTEHMNYVKPPSEKWLAFTYRDMNKSCMLW